MDERGRAWRRAQDERWKRRVLNYYGGYLRNLSAEERAAHAGILARTRHRCSGRCCGNPRRHFSGAWGGLTMQERRAADV